MASSISSQKYNKFYNSIRRIGGILSIICFIMFSLILIYNPYDFEFLRIIPVFLCMFGVLVMVASDLAWSKLLKNSSEVQPLYYEYLRLPRFLNFDYFEDFRSSVPGKVGEFLFKIIAIISLFFGAAIIYIDVVSLLNMG